MGEGQQRKGCFNLEVMGGASTVSYLLVELPCPLQWQGFESKTFGGRPGSRIKPGAPVGRQGILRKVRFFGGCGDPLQKQILTHAFLAFFFLLA